MAKRKTVRLQATVKVSEKVRDRLNEAAKEEDKIVNQIISERCFGTTSLSEK